MSILNSPPGTGKTWTLVEIVRQLVARSVNSTHSAGADAHPVKILICGASNLAVDNILERLLALPEKLDLTRVGHPARIMLGGVEGNKMLESTLEVKAGKSDQVNVSHFATFRELIEYLRLHWPKM
jgi:DNA polymerase alpha-associated DNA helicase A